MIDTTPIWFIAVCAIVVILLWIALELRQARKYGRQKHYINNFSITNADKPMTDRQLAAEKIRRSSTYGRDDL